MKKIVIKRKNEVVAGAEKLDPTDWIADCIASNVWGLPERWILASQPHDPSDVIESEVREITPAVEATVDEQGNELSPATDAITEEWVKLRAEYTVEIEDISAQLEQERINKEALDYLASTDWLIIREIDAGVACPAEIKQARAEARARIVR